MLFSLMAFASSSADIGRKSLTPSFMFGSYVIDVSHTSAVSVILSVTFRYSSHYITQTSFLPQTKT